MKKKRLLGLLGLGLLALSSFGFALSANNEKPVEPVKAAEDDTWMISMTLDVTSMHNPTNIYEFHYSGSKEGVVNLHKTGQDGIYSAIISFETDDFISNARFCTYNYDGQNLFYSREIDCMFLEPGTSLSRINNGRSFVFTGQWILNDNNEWKIGLSGVQFYPRLRFNYDVAEYSFEIDPVNQRYICRNVRVQEPHVDYFNIEYPYETTSYYYPVEMIRDASWEHIIEASDCWVYLEPGEYDFIIENSFEDNGIITINLHETGDTYIYYVLEDENPTGDYIYSWGGIEQFGEWPGTRITSVEGVEEVTNNGVLHFEGNDAVKLIYRIPLKYGFPTGDTNFKFNNHYDWQSDDLPIVNGAAYWYTGPANHDAGTALDFLIRAEEIRNGAADHSVCNIDEDSALGLIEHYNSLTAEVRDYINRSKTYTYKRFEEEGNELVSYYDIMVQISKNIDVRLVSNNHLIDIINKDTTSIIVIGIAIFGSIAALSLLLVSKKRKHN